MLITFPFQNFFPFNIIVSLRYYIIYLNFYIFSRKYKWLEATVIFLFLARSR